MKGYLDRHPCDGGTIPMTYGRYCYTFPEGHKRKGMASSIKGQMYRDNKKEIRWMAMEEYNVGGRKLYGDNWTDFEQRDDK